jgi:hypothetical protein
VKHLRAFSFGWGNKNGGLQQKCDEGVKMLDLRKVWMLQMQSGEFRNKGFVVSHWAHTL